MSCRVCQRMVNNTTARTKCRVLDIVIWCRQSLSSTATHNRHTRLNTDLYNVFNFIPTLIQTKPRERPKAAICVRKSSARRVLHFTPFIAASCVLHRLANRVIHRLQLYSNCIVIKHNSIAHNCSN